jgi:hypothetical protein
VVDPRRYEAPDADAVPSTVTRDGQSAAVDVCRLSWNGVTGILRGTPPSAPPPGPQLGRLDLTRVLGLGYKEVHFAPC